MNEFLKFYNEKYFAKGWKLEIYHSSIMGWCITLGYKTTHPKSGEVIFNIQSNDLEYIFARAQVLLKDWLIENDGRY